MSDPSRSGPWGRSSLLYQTLQTSTRTLINWKNGKLVLPFVDPLLSHVQLRNLTNGNGRIRLYPKSQCYLYSTVRRPGHRSAERRFLGIDYPKPLEDVVPMSSRLDNLLYVSGPLRVRHDPIPSVSSRHGDQIWLRGSSRSYSYRTDGT